MPYCFSAGRRRTCECVDGYRLKYNIFSPLAFGCANQILADRYNESREQQGLFDIFAAFNYQQDDDIHLMHSQEHDLCLIRIMVSTL